MLIALLYAFYYLVISVFTLKKKKNRKVYAPKARFAFIIAARNEECVIKNLVESLNAQNYPKELYTVYVVPNNCSDDTCGAALSAGAKIIDCKVRVKSKGEVLSYALKYIFKNDDNYDAICVCDADNLVHPNFLAEMNNAFCSGKRVAQGYRDSKNPYDSAISSCYSIYYWMINRFHNHARDALGLSAMINGSGFMVSVELLKEMNGWNTYTLTEDIEFTTQCLLRGEKVAWVPDAIIYDEQPLTFAQSWKQRKRWSTGLLQGLKRYTKILLQAAGAEKNFSCLDQVMFFISPLMQVICCIACMMATLLGVLYVHYEILPTSVVVHQMLLSTNFAYISCVFFTLIVTLFAGKTDFKLFKGFFTFYFFLMTWIPINVVVMFKKTTTWDEIKHTKSVSISEVSDNINVRKEAV